MGAADDVERLLDAVWPDVYRLAFSVLGNREQAKDAAQDACITLYRAIADLRETAAFRVWLYRIVVRAAMDVQRRHPVQLADEPQMHETDADAHVDLWRSLAALPAHERNAVVMRYFEDLSSREIASVLRVPDPTVRFWLASARRKLRPLLETHDISANSPEVRTNAT